MLLLVLLLVVCSSAAAVMRWCKPAAASGLLDHGRDAKDGAGDALALAGGGVPSSSSSDKLSGWCGGGVHVGQESVMVNGGEW